MSFHETIDNKAKQINSLLEELMPENCGFATYLKEAMDYSVNGGGKRLRPILMEETYRLFSEDTKNAKYFMGAIEMIHTYSLVHDDMPCMDNDEYRRGRKTTHAVYGEATALLVGDGLLNYAFETAAKTFDTDVDPVRVGRAMQILAGKAGIYGMIGGQAADVRYEKENEEMTDEKLLFIHKNKTAALIEASMMIGATLGGAKPEEVEQIEQVARAVGIAFQIKDDILDVTGSFEELGKPIGSDEKNHKQTYVTIHGLEKSDADVCEYSNKALHILASFQNRNAFLEQLITELTTRRK